jgi:CheY-like chemotaxis protein
MIDVGQQPSATKTRNKLSILLMDGNSERRALRKRIMALHGVEVVGACDSTEAASIWRRDRYDAVLIDIRRDHHGCVAWRDEIKKEKPQLAGSYVAEEQAAQWGDSLRKAILESCASLPLCGVLEVTKIKTVPYAPLSHPFVERLIGTVRRKFLDRTLFWTTADLETKLVDFQHYYNGHRTHAGLDGRPPEPSL